MIKRNKKGWIRIVESFIAVLLIAGILITVYVKQPKSTSNDNVLKIEDGLLAEISQDDSLREAVVADNAASIPAVNKFISANIPPDLNFTAKICNVSDICNLNYYNAEMYSRETIISSSITTYDPVKLKIFMWMKS